MVLIIKVISMMIKLMVREPYIMKETSQLMMGNGLISNFTDTDSYIISNLNSWMMSSLSKT